MEVIEILATVGFWAATLRIASPLIFATLGELICERAGVLNLGIEGIMTMGAMAGWMYVFQGGGLWGGVLFAASVDGAFLTMSAFDAFYFGMVNGRGWICIALVIFASWRPMKALLGALLFAGLDALQVRAQQISGVVIPYQFFLMLPFVLSIVAMIFMSRRATYPKALLVPFRRGERICDARSDPARRHPARRPQRLGYCDQGRPHHRDRARHRGHRTCGDRRRRSSGDAALR